MNIVESYLGVTLDLSKDSTAEISHRENEESEAETAKSAASSLK